MKSNVRNFIILLVLCFVLLLTPYIYRLVNVEGSLIGEDSYQYLRLASSKGFVYDELSFGGRFIVMEKGWPLMLSLFPLYLSWFLPVACGLFSFMLFYFLMGFMKDDLKRFVCTLLFVISPTFIYFFTVSNKYAPAFCLSLLGLYLFYRKRFFYGSLVLGLVSLFSVVFFIVNLVLFLGYLLVKDKLLLRYFFLSFLIGFGLVLLQFWRVLWYGLNFSLNYSFNLFTDFGAQFGLGFFILVLGILGVYYKKHYSVYLLLMLGFILACYFHFLVLYLNFVLVYYAGLKLIQMWKLKWSLGLLKYALFLVLVCSLLFSSVAYVNSYVKYYPNSDTLKGMDFLNGKKGVVFSDISRGHWITYGGTTNFVDSNYHFVPDYDYRRYVYERLLFSRDYSEFVRLIKENDIRYFWLDSSMKDRLYGGEVEGMWFWLEHGNDFELVYGLPDLEIWEFKG